MSGSSGLLSIPLAAVVPLGGAALLAIVAKVAPRAWRDLFAITVAVFATGFSLVTLRASSAHLLVYWFGGWRPSGAVVVGVDYVADPIGSALAALTGLLVTAALIYSSRYFDTVGGKYNSLVLVFLGGAVDFCMTGDLFNLFVAFELVAVTGFVLTGYQADQEGPLQGAINFAVTNSLAGMAVVMGIGLLYARTGDLNLAAIGSSLAGHQASGLVVVAFALLSGGYLVKAAVVPFHFWLPDAYGTAPIPVCVLFSGVMSELGLFAVARLWATVFSGLDGGVEHRLRYVLLGLGIVTALVGPIMALAQTQLKRLLAFVTMSHIGLYLIGFALLSPLGLAGAALLVLGDALAKSALILGVGVLQQQRQSLDERRLRGQGAGLWLVGVVVVLGALVLADLPPFVSSLGKDLVGAAAGRQGASWIEFPMAISIMISSGAVLRAGARIWLGWGPDEGGESESNRTNQPSEDDTDPNAPSHPGRPPLVILLPPLGLLGLALFLGLLPDLRQETLNAAAEFQNRTAYAAAVLHGTNSATTAPSLPPVSLLGLAVNAAEILGSIAVAGLALTQRTWAVKVRAWSHQATLWLRHQHSGHVGDQVTWLVAGLAVLAGLSAVALR